MVQALSSLQLFNSKHESEIGGVCYPLQSEKMSWNLLNHAVNKYLKEFLLPFFNPTWDNAAVITEQLIILQRASGRYR